MAAAAATIAVRVQVDAPAECPDERAFFDQIRARVPRAHEVVGADDARDLHVELRRKDQEILGTLTFDGAGPTRGEARVVRGPDCASVEAGLALVAAVVLDPAASVAPQPSPLLAASVPPSAPLLAPSPGLAPTPPALAQSPALEPLEDHEPARRDKRADPARLVLGAAMEIASGLGPDPAVVPRLFVDLDFPTALLRASARLSVGRAFSRFAATPAGTAQLDLTDVRLEPCVQVLSAGPFRLRGCGLVDVGVLDGQGHDTSHPSSAERGIVELGAGLEPLWVVHDQVVLGVLLGAAVPATRYAFYFTPKTPNNTAYEIPWGALLGEMSAGMRFW